ncbi:MAG: STAS domain-containing protein [Verrucomicrobiales bacterium]
MTLTEQDLGTAWLIELEGEADLAAVPELRRALHARRAAATRMLLVDFSKVTFVNTPVWALLIEYYQWASKNDAKFALTGLQGRALASFETVQLGTFISHYPDVDEALRRLARAMS